MSEHPGGDTANQLSDALTAQHVATRTVMEALLNRVTALNASIQITLLDVQQLVERLAADLSRIDRDLAAHQQREEDGVAEPRATIDGERAA